MYASDIILKNDRRTRYINYLRQKESEENSEYIVNLDSGSGRNKSESTLLEKRLGGTYFTRTQLDELNGRYTVVPAAIQNISSITSILSNLSLAALQANFTQVIGDTFGNLFAGDTVNNIVWFIDVINGTATNISSGLNINKLGAISIDKNNNLYISDLGNLSIRVYNYITKTILNDIDLLYGRLFAFGKSEPGSGFPNSTAYSNDNGITWVPYENDPFLNGTAQCGASNGEACIICGIDSTNTFNLATIQLNNINLNATAGRSLWLMRTVGSGLKILAICWVGIRWVVGGEGGNSGRNILYSNDPYGTSWSYPPNIPFSFAGGSYNNNAILSGSVKSIAFSKNLNRTIAVGYANGQFATVAYSDDNGIIWTYPTQANPFAGSNKQGGFPQGGQAFAISWSDTLNFWIIGGSPWGTFTTGPFIDNNNDPLSITIYYSSTGQTWNMCSCIDSGGNRVDPFAGGSCFSMTYNPIIRKFIAGGNPVRCFANSADGINWTFDPNPLFITNTTTSNPFSRTSSVVYTKFGLVACGIGNNFPTGGGQVQIATSQNGIIWTVSVSKPFYNSDKLNSVGFLNINPFRPKAMTIDKNFNIYFLDIFTPNTVSRVIGSGSPSGTYGTIEQYAGSINTGFLNANGKSALFNNPSGICIDSNGIIFVADTGNSIIRKIDLSANVTTYMGCDIYLNNTPTSFIVGPNNTAIGNNIIDGAGNKDGSLVMNDILFNNPTAMWFDIIGNMFICDSGNNSIRQLNISTGRLTTIGGIPGVANTYYPSIPGNFDNPNGYSLYNNPTSITYSGGVIYIYDTGNRIVRSINNPGTLKPYKSFNYNNSNIYCIINSSSRVGQFQDVIILNISLVGQVLTIPTSCILQQGGSGTPLQKISEEIITDKDGALSANIKFYSVYQSVYFFIYDIATFSPVFLDFI